MATAALVVSASGIVGSATATLLVAQGWAVHGLARRPIGQPDVHPVVADLQDAEATNAALSGIDPDAVFITTWLRQDSEVENIRVNSAMVRNHPRWIAQADGTKTRGARHRPQALSRAVRGLW